MAGDFIVNRPSDELQSRERMLLDMTTKPTTPEGDAPSEADRPLRMAMFLETLDVIGGRSDASDYSWNWINAYCHEHEGLEPDTFNSAEQHGFTTVSHDSDTDQSTVYLTEAGRNAIPRLRTALSTPEHPATPARGDVVLRAVKRIRDELAALIPAECLADGGPMKAQDWPTREADGACLQHAWDEVDTLLAALASHPDSATGEG